MGLSLSYDIVKAHGGELKVETKEGEGSEFVILLPKTNSETAEQVIQRIIKKNSKEKVDNIMLSVSFGWDTKIDVSLSIEAGSIL